MTAATVLVILVATGEGRAVETTAMAAAAAEVIGVPDSVRVDEASPPADVSALRLEQGLGARAVVALTWNGPDHLKAHLRLHSARTDRWIDRELAFAMEDKRSERGRALGFAMASMLPASDPTFPLATASESTAPTAPPPPLGSNAVEASFLAASGIGGPAGGLGARLGGERFVAPSVSLDLSAAGRAGRLQAVDAKEVTVSAGVGAAIWPIAPTRGGGGHAGLALRGEILLLYQAVAHTNAAGTTARRSQVMPGGVLTVEGTWSIARRLEFLLAGGAEIAAGTIDVTVVARSPQGGTARIPACRALASAGVRVRF
jgi:hypothetical protein